ncbi:MAG: hypothetical protein EOP56_08075 [Sphingobacteriales bacterium]|nr:MAG: hypothetical protein EOP56_08075 [Sphingobacteriales bacterium]
MRRMLLLILMVVATNFSYAQWVEHQALLSTPKYLPIGEQVNAVVEMNALINSFVPDYEQTRMDTNNRERIYVYTNPAGHKLYILYTYGVNSRAKMVNRISINGDQNDVLKIYNGYFNTDRTINPKKHTYQLDFFEYNGMKYHARMDPEIEDSKVVSWSIYIGKY